GSIAPIRRRTSAHPMKNKKVVDTVRGALQKFSATLVDAHLDLLHLPEPRDSQLAGADLDEHAVACLHFYEIWTGLPNKYQEVLESAPITINRRDKTETLSGRDLWFRLVLIAGKYYAYAACRIVSLSKPGKGWTPAGTDGDDLRELIDRRKDKHRDIA